MSLPGMRGWGLAASAAAGSKVPVLQAAPKSGSSGSGFTFSSQPFGAPAADRQIVVAIHWKNGVTPRSISSVTIGGVSATVLRSITGSNTCGAAFAIATVPSGSTGSVIIAFAGSVTGCGVAIHSLYGLVSNTDTDWTSATGNGKDLNLTTTAGGVAFYTAATGQITTTTWTTVAEGYDEQNSFFTFSGAAELTAGTSATARGTFGSSSGTVHLAVALN